MNFDWDESNLNHIARHAISAEEVEFVLSHPTLALPAQDWFEDEERFAEVGVTAQGRILHVITTLRGFRIRVVTAWDADRDITQEYLETR